MNKNIYTKGKKKKTLKALKHFFYNKSENIKAPSEKWGLGVLPQCQKNSEKKFKKSAKIEEGGATSIKKTPIYMWLTWAIVKL